MYSSLTSHFRVSSNLVYYLQSSIHHLQIQPDDSSLRRVQNRAARRTQAQAGGSRGAIEGEEGRWVG
jgi:hypothetical protein